MAAASAPSGAKASSRELIDPDPDSPRLAAGDLVRRGDPALVAPGTRRHLAELEPFAEATARDGGGGRVGARVFARLDNPHLPRVAAEPRDHLEAAGGLLHDRHRLR